LSGAWRLLQDAMLTQADLEIQTVAVFDAATNALGAGRVVPLSQAYTPPTGLYDEMFTPAGGVRPHCLGPARSLLRMTPGQLVGLRSDAERMLLRHGVTFNVYSEQAGIERIFPFDVMPRIIDYDTWTGLEAGLIQRVRALNAFVADVYREGHILKDGLIPRDLILDSPNIGAVRLA